MCIECARRRLPCLFTWTWSSVLTMLMRSSMRSSSCCTCCCCCMARLMFHFVVLVPLDSSWNNRIDNRFDCVVVVVVLPRNEYKISCLIYLFLVVVVFDRHAHLHKENIHALILARERAQTHVRAERTLFLKHIQFKCMHCIDRANVVRDGKAKEHRMKLNLNEVATNSLHLVLKRVCVCEHLFVF